MPETAQLVTFYVGDQLFGIDVRAVQEIIRKQRITPVPLSDPAIRGLINLRGQIVTVIDLRHRLQLRVRDAGEEGVMNVVADADGGAVSFQVDRIGDVIDVDESTFEPAPLAIPAAVRELLAGIHKLPDRFLHVLSVDKIAGFRSRLSLPNHAPLEAH